MIAHSASPRVEIRQMDPTHKQRIIEIDHIILEKNRPDYWEMKLDLVQTRDHIYGLVAQVDGYVVGFVIGGTSKWEYGMPENIGWLDTIGIDPAFQGLGIARTLFGELADRLKSKGIDKIVTFVNRRDWQLMKFFNHLGFEKGDMINLELDIG